MNTIAQIFPRTGRISGPEVADGVKPDVPTTELENEKNKTKHHVFYEAVDAHARGRLINISCKTSFFKSRKTGTVIFVYILGCHPFFGPRKLSEHIHHTPGKANSATNHNHLHL